MYLYLCQHFKGWDSTVIYLLILQPLKSFIFIHLKLIFYDCITKQCISIYVNKIFKHLNKQNNKNVPFPLFYFILSKIFNNISIFENF